MTKIEHNHSTQTAIITDEVGDDVVITLRTRTRCKGEGCAACREVDKTLPLLDDIRE